MTAKRRWPAATDYIDAMQHPGHTFTRPELKNAQFDLDMFGIPDGATGSNAVVFKAEVGQRTAALRCFTSQAGLSRERYLALARHCQAEPSRAKWVVPAAWSDDEVRVKGDLWPLVEMDWIDGRPLDVYVESLCKGNADALDLLADQWREMLRDLEDARIAHGDLQQGNVMIDKAKSELHLVDLDGTWVPGMDGLESPDEAGHPAFRHPDRVSAQAWGPWMDTFPGLVVLTSLRALARQPDLWTLYNNGDNLIFTAGDFTDAGRTPLWSDLAHIQDPVVAELLDVLRRCCDPSWKPTGTLEALLRTGAQPATVSAPKAGGFAPPATSSAPFAPGLTLPPETTTDGFDWPVAPETPISAPVMVPVAPAAPTASLPPPPSLEPQQLYVPVTNPVNIGPPTTSNPFGAPPGVSPRPSVPTSQGQARMASGYKAWAIIATVLSGVLLGLPGLLMAHQAEVALNRGDHQRAVRLSRWAVGWAVGTLILTLALVIVLASVGSRSSGY